MKIFWRIFLAFWLSTSAIMLLTAYIVVHKVESSRVMLEHQQTAEAVAKQLIALYEENRRLPRRLHRFMPPPHVSQTRIPMPLSLVIIDTAQKEIYRSASAPKKYHGMLELTVEGEAGITYRVLANKPIFPYLLRYLFARMFSIQLLVVLLVTAIVSAILCHFLVRPLKLLGQYSQQFAMRENVDVPSSVLARRDELGDLARDLAHMSAQITTLINNQQQLLHDVSHELRAPLARIQARVALLEQAGVNPKTTDALHDDCDKLNQLIQRVLDYARLNRDSEELKRVDIGSLINAVIAGVKVEFPLREIKAENLPIVQSEVYPEALSSALENVLRNACIYTAHDTPIEVAATAAEKTITFTVRDYGDGINNAEREKLLEPFYRSGERMHGEGFGLGLSIAKRAIVKHGGSIALSNADGGGLLVTFQIAKI